jgi:IPT/TIG domain
MSVSPPTANYRTKLAFTGTGFAPGESVLIYTSGVGSDILARATAGTAGAFTADAREPESPFGPRMFLGVGRRSGKLGAANLSVTTRLILQPTSGPPGSTVTVQGYGFASDEELSINWNESTRLGRVAANVHGTFNGAGSVTFTVPAGAAPGIYTVTAKGAIPRLRGVASFTVE